MTWLLSGKSCDCNSAFNFTLAFLCPHSSTLWNVHPGIGIVSKKGIVCLYIHWGERDYKRVNRHTMENIHQKESTGYLSSMLVAPRQTASDSTFLLLCVPHCVPTHSLVILFCTISPICKEGGDGKKIVIISASAIHTVGSLLLF